MAWTEIIDLARCEPGRGTFVEHTGRELAVFRFADPERVYVIDNTCPHANGNLAGGSVEGCIVSCPWHHWQFDLQTGICVHSDKARVRRYEAAIRHGAVWADLEDNPC